MTCCRFTIRSILLVVTGVAIFCAGYGVGFRNGHEGRFDDLIMLIRQTIAPSDWITTGSSENGDGGCSISVPDDSAVQNPFTSTSVGK